MLAFTLKGLEQTGKNIEKWADHKADEMRKAMSLAIQKEGYRVMNMTRDSLKYGRLGLEPKAEYRNVPADPDYRKHRVRPPLSSKGMVRGITYAVDKRALTMDIGFLGLRAGTAWQAEIAKKSMYRFPITEPRKQHAHRWGIHFRKETTSVDVPSRDIIGTVLAREGQTMLDNIDDMFHRKMRGEYI
jgi:hypothetical protein